MALHPIEHDRIAGLALCAGVGGLEIGLKIAEPGYDAVCMVERNAFAAAVLVARMADQALGDAAVWDDLVTFDGRPWRGKVDCVTAGYPCQPFSPAGLRRGVDDPRHLWPHVARIIGEIEPEWVFCENVAGHVDHGFDQVVAELQGMGYRVEAGLFSAAEVGAAHWRARLFLLAHRDSGELGELAGHRPGSGGRRHPDADEPRRIANQPEGTREELDAALAVHDDAGDAADRSAGLPLFAPCPFDYQGWFAALAQRPDLQPCLYGLADGVAAWVDRTAAAGNGVVSLVAAYAWRTLKARF